VLNGSCTEGAVLLTIYLTQHDNCPTESVSILKA